MAERYATKDGDWSDVTVWDGGASKPGASDDVYPNGFTVDIDEDITVNMLRNDAGSTAAANGGFTVTDATRTINADLLIGATATAEANQLIRYSGTGTLTLNGDPGYDATVSDVFCVSLEGSGDIVFTGDGTATHIGSYGQCVRLGSSGTGDFTFNGDIAVGTGTAYQYWLNGISGYAGAVNINGDVTAGAGYDSHAIVLQGSGLQPVTIVGDVTGGTGGSYAATGLYHAGSGAQTVTITGDVRGTDSGTGIQYGIYVTSGSSTVTVTGSISSGNMHPGAYIAGTLIHSGNIGTGTAGDVPIVFGNSARYWIHESSTFTHTYLTNDAGVAGDARSLYTGGTDIGNPAETDVRSGTTFGPASEYTGSLAVPGAQYVSQGVSVDATVGTLSSPSAADIADAVCDEVLSGHTTAGTLGKVLSDVLVDTGTTLPAQISALNDLSAADVNAECDTAIADAGLATAAALAAVDGIVDSILVDTGTTLPAQISALNDLSAADVNAQCDTAIADAALATAASLSTVASSVAVVDTWTKRIATKEFGAISNAGTSGEEFTLADLGITVTFAGLDEKGNRTGASYS